MALWEGLALLFALVVVVWRIVSTVRRNHGRQPEEWDEKLVRNLRAQSRDPFQPADIDFFFSLPDEAGCVSLAGELRTAGFAVDHHAPGAESTGEFTLRARKALPISVSAVQETVTLLRQAAMRHGASYDGWAAAGMLRERPAASAR